MSEPKVDILTITYNQERYINKCIDSVLAQTYDNWQMIVVDDGSDDQTRDKIKAYKDDRIVLICLPHRGIEKLKASYGTALEHGHGELLAILDGDDWWPPDKLAIEVPFFQSEQVVLAFGSANLYNEDNRFIKCARLPKFARGLQEGNAIIHKILSEYYFPYSVTTMLRRSAISALGGFVQPEELPLVDLPTWLNLLQNMKCVGIPEVLGCYRVHDESVCRKRSLTIDRQQMNYNEIYLEHNWQKLGFGERAWPAYRKKIHSYNSHKRGVFFMMEKEWAESQSCFKQSFIEGKLLRKIKVSLRIMQMILMKYFNKLNG